MKPTDKSDGRHSNQNSIIKFCGKHSRLRKNSLKSILKSTNTVSQQTLCLDDSEEESFCCIDQPRAAFQEQDNSTWTMDTSTSSCKELFNPASRTKSLSIHTGHGELPILDPLLSRVVLTPKMGMSSNESTTNHKYQNFHMTSNEQSTNSGTNLHMNVTPIKLKMHHNNLFTKNINQETHNPSPGKVSNSSSVVTRASSSDDQQQYPANNGSATGSMELLWDAECLELTQSSQFELCAEDQQDNYRPSHDHLVSSPSNRNSHASDSSSSATARYDGSHHLTHEQVPIQTDSFWNSSTRHPPDHRPFHLSASNFHDHSISSFIPFPKVISRDTTSGCNISFISGNDRNSDNSFAHLSSIAPPSTKNSNISIENGSNVIDHDGLEWDNYDCDFIDDDDGEREEDFKERF